MINRISEYEDRTAIRSFDESAEAIRATLNLSHVDRFAREHPAAVLAMGAALGLAFGWWVKRK